MQFPQDYAERVYAGVLGKIIGVYLGRPIEGWSYERITEQFGEIGYYVHDALGARLVVTDDDISGTFTFLRALADYHYDPNITAAQIGQTWLNYIIEDKTILWWGGNGISTEHTAFLRLKHGIAAPESGSIALNGRTVAEQIGSQIFIDGWGLICPGDPERAVDFAQRAASVSHDGEAIYGAQVVAALVAQAFVEDDIDTLIDTAAGLIPSRSIIYRMIAEIREWHAAEPDDWRATRLKIAESYGYDKYGGGCHMVPNHALIIHALLHGGGDFSKSQTIVNTCGWDTDCNAANVGCILGVRGGLAAIDKDKAAGKDWRGPVADRMFLPTADGGRCVTDALQEAMRIVETAHRVKGLPWEGVKNRARFSFALPGSVQGFSLSSAGVSLSNASGNGLTVRFAPTTETATARVQTPTFPGFEELKMPGYGLLASPTLYPGQSIKAEIAASPENQSEVTIRLYVEHVSGQDETDRIQGEPYTLAPGGRVAIQWPAPGTGRQPITAIGLEVLQSSATGSLTLESLDWNGVPNCELHRPAAGDGWLKAWVVAANPGVQWQEPTGFRLCSNEGIGMAIQGAHEWADYKVSAAIKPILAERAGIAGRVQGQERYYALLFARPGKVQLVKRLDGEKVLVERDFPWDFQTSYDLEMVFSGPNIKASVDGKTVFEHEDGREPLDGGAIAVLVEDGNLVMEEVQVGADEL